MSNTPKNQLTKEEANSLFVYADGEIYQKDLSPSNGPIGWINNPKKPYKKTRITKDGETKKYAVHNIIWNMHYGIIPEGFTIDHIDRDSMNNNIENLRLATSRRQTINSKIRVENKSGVKGVSWEKTKMKWRAEARDPNGVKVRLGSFSLFKDAVTARKAAEVEFGY